MAKARPFGFAARSLPLLLRRVVLFLGFLFGLLYGRLFSC